MTRAIVLVTLSLSVSARALADQNSVSTAPVVSAATPASPVDAAAAEWKFLKKKAEDERPEVVEAVLTNLSRLVAANPDADFWDEAQLLKSDLHARAGDARAAVVDALKLLYERPDSVLAFQAKRALADIVDKRMERKLKPILSEIAKGPDSASAAASRQERMAELLRKIVDRTGEALYEPTVAEFEEFFGRYPAYAKIDELQLALARLHVSKGRYQAAILDCGKLLALYPQSASRAQAQLMIGDVWSDHIKDYNKALDAYQEVVNGYAQSPEAGSAYERMAALEERMKQYDLAIDVYDKMIKLYPGADEAAKAFGAKARLLDEDLGKADEAIQAYGKLADMFKGSLEEVKALKQAGRLAYRQKDYAGEAAFYERLAKECADMVEAPQALYDAAEIYEKRLNDWTKAGDLYAQFAQTYPKNKLAKKAAKRAKAMREKIG